MKLSNAQKKFLRYTVGLVLFPIIAVAGPIYKWYRKVRYHKQTQIKTKDIVDAFSYLVVKDSEVEKLARKRAEVCGACRYARYNKVINTIVVGETIHQIKGMECDLCGCSLAGKVRGENEGCPIHKW
jgi:hypothetical protein